MFLVLLSAAAVCAQEAASPTPTPNATPVPTQIPVPSPAPLPPEAPAPLEPAATPSPTPDVIPMEGAPLDTQDIAPLPTLDQAMPDDAFTQPNALVPDEAPPAISQSLDNAQEKARLQNIRYKEVRVQVEKDPKVKSLLAQADRSKTQEDKRAALREYYRLLFKKIVAIDKSLAEKCEILETSYIHRLAQIRLEPTIPLNPPPTPEPLN